MPQLHNDDNGRSLMSEEIKLDSFFFTFYLEFQNLITLCLKKKKSRNILLQFLHMFFFCLMFKRQ